MNMAKEIWKYEIASDATLPVTTLEMPRRAKVLHVNLKPALLHQRVMLWVAVNTISDMKEQRRFTVIPTGVPYYDVKEYIGTVHFEYGFVGHVFELAP